MLRLCKQHIPSGDLQSRERRDLSLSCCKQIANKFYLGNAGLQLLTQGQHGQLLGQLPWKAAQALSRLRCHSGLAAGCSAPLLSWKAA